MAPFLAKGGPLTLIQPFPARNTKKRLDNGELAFNANTRPFGIWTLGRGRCPSDSSRGTRRTKMW